MTPLERDRPIGIWWRLTTCPCGCGKSRWWYWRSNWERSGRWVVEESHPESEWTVVTTRWTKLGAKRAAREPLFEGGTCRVLRAGKDE